MMPGGNLLRNLPEADAHEVFEPLLSLPGAVIERIVSHGQATPPGEWYDQVQTEWVAILAGAAKLLIDGESEPRMLHPGDYLLIPPHARHRVEWTDPDHPTVWLAVHVTQPDNGT